MTPRVLMVAYHFPPLAGSSGIQRTLRFVQHLARFGWSPLVLSASPRAYERTSTDLDAEVPPSTVVRRALALDAARHLSVGGRYWAALARPDRWTSWRFDGVRQGLRMIEEFQPQVLWSTFPIPTAHVIAAELQQRSGLPWVADFRDPMAQDGYPPDPRTWQQFKAIEERTLARAACCLFTTPSAARTYREHYPDAAERVAVMENGYDEESFAAVERRAAGAAPRPLSPGVPTLLHSGTVYPDERDPTQLFAALARMKQAGHVDAHRLQLRFRAPLHDEQLAAMAQRHGVADLVQICPPLGYQDALDEMLRADALLLMQAANCNEQVPAKLYEYLRARRPILCLSDPAGDTRRVLREAGIEPAARLDSPDEIAALLSRLLRGELAGLVASDAAVAGASRLGRTQALAGHFDRLVAGEREAAGSARVDTVRMAARHAAVGR